MHYILKDKKIIKTDRDTWNKFAENFDNRRIKVTNLESGKMISTVFIGLAMSYNSKDEPMGVIETAVFGTDEELDKIYKYSNYEDAIKDHAKIVDQEEMLDRYNKELKK